MNVPARFRPQVAPAPEPAAVAPEDNQAMHEFFALHERLKLQVRDLTDKFSLSSTDLAQVRFEREYLTAEVERLRIQVRELTAANHTYKVSTSALAMLAVAEIERFKDICDHAVRDVTTQGQALAALAESKSRDIHDAAVTAVKRIFDSKLKAAAEADEHALRAGINPDEEPPKPEPIDEGMAAIAAKFGANNRPDDGDQQGFSA